MAIGFRGATSTDGIDVPQIPESSLPQGPWAISGWVRLSSTQGGGNYPCIFLSGSWGSWSSLGLAQNWYGGTDNGLAVEWLTASNNPAWAGYVTTTNYTDDTWHHVVMQYNGTNFQFFFDGVNTVDSSATVGSATSARPMYFNRRGASSYPSEGDYADWGKWDRSLSFAEILGLASGKTCDHYPKDLKWYLPMEGYPLDTFRKTQVGTYAPLPQFRLPPVGVTSSGGSMVAHPDIDSVSGIPYYFTAEAAAAATGISAYQLPRIAHPDFMDKTRRPLGPIKLKAEHPALSPSNYPKHVLVATPAGMYDMLNNKLYTPSTFPAGSYFDGRGWRNPAGSYLEWTLDVGDADTDGGVQCVLFAGRAIAASDFDDNLWTLAFTNNRATWATASLGISPWYTNQNELGMGTASAQSLKVSDGGGMEGHFVSHTQRAVDVAASGDMFYNVCYEGKSIARDTFTGLESFHRSMNYLSIGETGANNVGSLEVMCVWNGYVPDVILDSLAADPFQLFEPAVPLVYFAGTADTVPPVTGDYVPFGHHLLDRQYAAIAAHRLGGVLQ